MTDWQAPLLTILDRLLIVGYICRGHLGRRHLQNSPLSTLYPCQESDAVSNSYIRNCWFVTESGHCLSRCLSILTLFVFIDSKINIPWWGFGATRASWVKFNVTHLLCQVGIYLHRGIWHEKFKLGKDVLLKRFKFI